MRRFRASGGSWLGSRIGAAIGLAITLALLSTPSDVFAQAKQRLVPPAIDILGVHNASGRGCSSCHAPHSVFQSFTTGGRGMWEPAAPVNSEQAITFGENGRVVQVARGGLGTPGAEVAGVVLCISCHDGNVTPQNMLADQPYEERVGLRAGSGRQQLQTFLDDADSPRRSVVDHPFGADAKIELGNGLVFRNGEFAVIPGTPYAQFVANYGWPSLAPLTRSNPYGVDAEGRPYLVCTTCHNQHAMNVYLSSSGSPIASDAGKGSYTTFFFVNGPYNPSLYLSAQNNTSSNVQFCRQCHFSFSNEANNVNNVRTAF